MGLRFRSIVGVSLAGLALCGCPVAHALDWMPRSDSRMGEDCVTALAHCEDDGRVYAVDGTADELVTIDPESGVVHRVGPLGFPVVTALAATKFGTLYGVDGYGDQLLRIDRKTGRAKPIGELGFRSIQSLAFDRDGRLLGVDTATDQLVEIDIHCGDATVIGGVDAPSVFGMTCGPDGCLYAVDLATCGLYLIDPKTAATRHVGRIQQSLVSMSGLTVTDDGQLIAYESIRDSLFLLNTTTAKPSGVTMLVHHSLRSWLAWLVPEHWVTQLLLSISVFAASLAFAVRTGRLLSHRLLQWRRPADVVEALPV